MRKIISKLPFRVIVAVPFVALILLAVGLTNYIRYRNEENAVNDLSSQINQQVAARINQHLQNYLSTPIMINQLNLDAIQVGELNLNDQTLMENYFLTQIQRFDSVDSLAYASEDRLYVGAVRNKLGRNLMIGISSVATNYTLEAIDAQGSQDIVSTLANYDPRPRPWYQAAVLAGRETWTPIFVWPSPSNDVGLDAVVPVYAQGHRLLGVLDTSLTLNEIGSFLKGLNISPHGEIFIMDRSGLLIASSTIQYPFTRTGDQVDRLAALQSPDAIMQASAQALDQKIVGLSKITGPLSLPFNRSGALYTADVTPYKDSYGLDWLIISVYPESDFTGTINLGNQQAAALTGLSLLGALFLASLITLWVTRPITRLNQSARALSRGDWSKKVTIDRSDEVGELSASFDAMAEQLRASFELIQASEESYRNLFENSTIGMYRTTPDGQIQMSNPALLQMLGYGSFEELGQRNLEQEGYEPGYERKKFQERLESEGKVTGLESAWTRKDGSIVFVRESAKAFRDTNGKVLYYEGTVEDISERKRGEEKIQQQLKRLTALSEIEIAITSTVDLHLILGRILAEVAAQLGVDAVDVLLLNPSLQTLEYSAGRGFRTPAIQSARIRVGESFAGQAASERRIIQIANLKDHPENLLLTRLLAQEEFVCYYGVPLIAKGKVIGVLEVFHRTPLDPDAEWLNFLSTLAGQAAIAIDNATLFENMQRSNIELSQAYGATIEGWSRALDLRDKETEGHTQRVTEMTLKLARAFGLNEDELMQVRWGALLHDIGKMGVPDGILLKSGPLTDEEWVMMKKHPSFAYELLSQVRYLRNALDIPYRHHEKWDGTGYPSGLRGDQIPISARIFAVVDVWDAMISDRPYRAAWTTEKILEHIRTLSGSHFDPHVVKVFLEEKIWEIGSLG